MEGGRTCDARVAIVPLGGHIADVPHPSQHLDCLVGDKSGGFRRLQLGHGRLRREGGREGGREGHQIIFQYGLLDARRN